MQKEDNQLTRFLLVFGVILLMFIAAFFVLLWLPSLLMADWGAKP